MKAKRRANLAVSYLILVIISIIWLFPFVCLLLQSFRGYSAADGGGGMVNYLIPKRWTLDSYKFLFKSESKLVSQHIYHCCCCNGNSDNSYSLCKLRTFKNEI